jgi:hypothetical protein
VAQIEDGRKYQQQYNKLLNAYRRLVRKGPGQQVLTPQEQALLDKQQHYGYSDLSQPEQQKLKGEIDVMWGQIPAHLQDKARGLAGIS